MRPHPRALPLATLPPISLKRPPNRSSRTTKYQSNI
jgi:hypothetical protein